MKYFRLRTANLYYMTSNIISKSYNKITEETFLIFINEIELSIVN